MTILDRDIDNHYFLFLDSLLPGLKRYFEVHIETGGFLRAVLENDLLRAVKTADPNSFRALPVLVDFLLEYAPAKSWGSKEAVAAWLSDETRQHETQLRQLRNGER